MLDLVFDFILTYQGNIVGASLVAVAVSFIVENQKDG